MTDSPTPTPAALGEMAARHREHPPIDGVLGMVAYCAECYDNWPCDAATLGAALDAAERLAVFEREQRDLRHAAWLEERDGRDAADRSAAAWESNYNVLNGEIMAGIEAKLAGAERRAAEADQERDEALTQRADFEIGLTLAQDDLAAAARENERLARQIDEYHEWVEYALKELPDWMYPVGHEDVHAALAAEPREPRGENQ